MLPVVGIFKGTLFSDLRHSSKWIYWNKFSLRWMSARSSWNCYQYI